MLQWPYELELFVTQPRFLVKDKLHPERLLKNKMESKIIYTSMCHECHVFRFFESGPVWGKEGNTGKHRWRPFLTILFSELSFFCLWESVQIIVKLLCVCVLCVCWVVFVNWTLLDVAYLCVCVFFVFLGMLFDGVRWCCLILFDVVDCCWCVLFVHELFLMFSDVA